MMLRTATIFVCILDAAIWLFVAFEMFASGSDPATSGLDEAAGYVVTALFLITAVPALALMISSRAPRTALALALVFPLVFAGLVIAAILVFA